APASVSADTLTVTNTDDAGPGSLRQAIADAQPGEVITFAPSATGTILLSSTLVLTKSLTILGPGAAALAIDGNNAVGVFSVYSGAAVTLEGLTLQRGRAGVGGGAIYAGSANLTLTNSTLRDNTVVSNGD